MERWFGPESGDRYRLALILLLAVLGTPPVVYDVLIHVESLRLGLVLAGLSVGVATLAVLSRGMLQSWMPAVAAAHLAVLVRATGAADSHLTIAFLLIALASAFMHEPRWFVVNLVWIVTMAALPLVYGERGITEGSEAGLVEGAVMLAAVVVVHVLSQVLRARNRRLQAVLEEQRVTIAHLQEARDAKDLFLSALSHELRTPLTSIVGIAHTVRDHEERLEPAQKRDLMGRMVVNSQRLERLLTDLLDLRRLQEGAAALGLTIVGLPDVVEAALADVECGDRSVHVDVPAVAVNIDRSKVERIIVNLVANACKHTPPESTIWVRVSAADAVLRIVVEDDGPGVSDELKLSVFEAFQQGPQSRDDPSPGTGVGLSIVDQFARLHGGHAWVEDRPGGGAAFHVQMVAHGSRRARLSTSPLAQDGRGVGRPHETR